jgi:hypothetical protein
MELIPNNEVFQEDKRNTKKMMLPTDAVCAKCGIIFNSVYEDSCLICEDFQDTKEDVKERTEEIKEEEKPVIRFVEEKDEGGKEVCQHTDFITGRQSVDLRILLDFHVEDIRALCEIHGCPEGGSRGKMVVNIMRHLHSNLDKRIDEHLVRMMIIRNRKKFRFWRDIESAISKAKRSERIELVSADDCIEITELGQSQLPRPKGRGL